MVRMNGDRTLGDDDFLTTRQVLVALEEMPPHTAYFSLAQAADGSEDATVIARLDRDDPGAYLIAVLTADLTKALARVFPDRDTFVMTIGNMRPVVSGGGWTAGWAGMPDTVSVDIIDALRQTVPTAVASGTDLTGGCTLWIDFATGTVAIVNR
jgi:hypothetical protein